jgi:hypothetical protein
VSQNPSVQLYTIELLTPLLLIPGGHYTILDALTYLQESGKEKERFISTIRQINDAKTVEAQVRSERCI